MSGATRRGNALTRSSASNRNRKRKKNDSSDDDDGGGLANGRMDHDLRYADAESVPGNEEHGGSGSAAQEEPEADEVWGETDEAAAGDFMENWIFRVREKEQVVSMPREGHFVLPFSRKDAFHKNHRRFLMVGLRLVQFQHEQQLVGWCDATDGCCGHSPGVRETFPGADFPLCHPEVLGDRRLCPIAKLLVEELGGEDAVNFLLQRDPVPRPAPGEKILSRFTAANGIHYAVNANGPDVSVFPAWGIVKVEKDKSRCLTCRSHSRHCTHCKTFLGTDEPDLNGPLSHSEFEKKLSKKLDPATGRFRLLSHSTLKLPFWADDPNPEFADVCQKYRGTGMHDI